MSVRKDGRKGRCTSDARPLTALHRYAAPREAPWTPPDRAILVYCIRTGAFREESRNKLIQTAGGSFGFLELRASNPPLLVDGRMQIVDIPKGTPLVTFKWRANLGSETKVLERVVWLPPKVYCERNVLCKWDELWIER